MTEVAGLQNGIRNWERRVKKEGVERERRKGGERGREGGREGGREDRIHTPSLLKC